MSKKPAILSILTLAFLLGSPILFAADECYQATLLCAASNGNNTETVQMFLENRKIAPNAQGEYCPLEIKKLQNWFLQAVDGGDIEIIQKLLLTQKIDLNTQENGLIQAASSNYIEIVKLLLANKAININAVTSTGRTALMLAAHSGYIEVVKLLQLIQI